MIEDVYKKRIKVRNFLDKCPDHNLIVDIMKKTHNLVASKQNLMPYKIHVLGPECVKLKQELYNLTIAAAPDNFTPSKANYQVYAPYVFIFTTRLAEPNASVKISLSKGHALQACFPETYLSRRAVQTACLEIGMWSWHFTGLCLENDIDVAYLKCFNSDHNNWSFIDEEPLFGIAAGYKLKDAYNRLETKPNWNDVVCFEHE